MIQTTRIRLRSREPIRKGGRYVLYWMQQSQRTRFNPSLELAISEANALGLPVLAAFGLTDGFPEANARHYHFMLQGLVQAARNLAQRGVGFAVRRGSPEAVALELSQDAALVVCDRGYLRIQRAWRKTLAQAIGCRLLQVEGDVVVPVETASPKHEYAARTLRPKLHRLWEDYVQPLEPIAPERRAGEDLPRGDVDLDDLDAALAALDVDRSVRPVRRFRGGEDEAQRRLDAFLADGLTRYAEDRGRPEAHAASQLSPYLHFGQISPVDIALRVRAAAAAGSADRAAYLEELIVRRELAMNHALYEPQYDRYDCLPEWARATLAAQGDAPRPHLYDLETLEAGRTHDRYWNAAQLEMRATGYMHNRLRMYWGKKILEWSPSPEEAWRRILHLNNRYFLDGRDPNSYANVGWIFGLHDRPWGPRPVFGTVRSMGANSLKSFDAEAYVAEVERLAAAEG
ncbi:MAG: deoxyribodipyrimidine photo-lyase [Phenylobacterium sp.]|uniref:deoxyribodipyrimidine photo-lyase n=1 Tax=Phenylobacterium sp. TaxID=1871053 RepID=UPI003919DE68